MTFAPRTFGLWLTGALFAAGCSLDLDPEVEVVRAIYDLAEGDIPMPNDLVRDAEAGQLEIPTDDEELTPSEVEFYQQLNTLDGWPTTFSVTLKFSAPISEDTVDASTVQVWRWGDQPVRAQDWTFATHRAGTELELVPPLDGWLPGSRYVVLVRGGPEGLRGRLNQPVVADPSFYFARQADPIDGPEHERAFPGDTHAERLDTAADLEEVRLELKPYLDAFEQLGYPRNEVAALWTFTTTAHAELVIDRASQRVPLPFDLLLDPATGRVDLPIHPEDDALRRQIKSQVNGLDGFALSANLTFEFSQRLAPASVTPRDIKLYRLDGLPVEVPVDAWLMADGIHVVVEPLTAPLAERTRYGLVVYDGLRDEQNRPVVASPVGMFLKGEQPLWASGHSLNGALDDLEAERVERVRLALSPLLDQIGRDHVVSGWTFTTQSVLEPLLASVSAAEDLNVDPNPTVEDVKTNLEAMADFVIGIGSLLSVGDVFYGTIPSPVFLDPVSRAFREDGSYQVENIAFVMTVPADADPSVPLPVVIFGHAIMTERRFVLAVADFLARQGFAAVAIDLPYHGTRTHCKRGGPISVPHPLTGELIDLNPCTAGTTCAVDGRCVDSHGQGNALTQWPIIGYPMASGAAFLEMEQLAATRDHFTQAVIDLRSLTRSLQQGDWQAATGYQFDTSKLYYLGQSLGGIIGAVFTPITPEIDRAVWNVPGCDLVDMFAESGYFGMQVDAFFQREEILRSSYDAEQFLDVARWIMDGVDPASIAHLMRDSERKALIQMATLDFIIPNRTTELLGEISSVPRRDYVAEHAFLCIPVEPAYIPGNTDAAAFLAGEFDR